MRKRLTLCTRLFPLVMAIMFASYGFAAEVEADRGTITGVLVNDSTSAPVSFASVALINGADSSIITGVITDDLGKFSFNNLPYGKYNIKATFVGYKTVQIKGIEVSSRNRSIDLHQMKMAEDIKAIDAAVVVGQRLKGEEKIDRTVFTLNDDVRKASTNALDALKHIPSVTVDFQKNVSLEGQTNIQFYVDGVLRNKEYIAQIKPDMIDKIELITNPGVKYDADVSGVINIVLKKEARYGISGSVKIPFPHPVNTMAEPGANIEYGNQKFRFYANDQLHYERFNGSEILSTRIDDVNGSPYSYNRKGEGKNSWQQNYMNYGIDWFINDKSSLNFLGEWRNWCGTTKNYHITSKTMAGDDLQEYLKTGKSSKDKSDNYYFSLYYQRKLQKEGDDFKVEAYYNQQNGKINNNYADTYINTEDLVTPVKEVFRKEYTDNNRRNGELKLDLTYTIKNLKNEMGLRTFASWMGSDFTKQYTIEELGHEETDEFDYRETRQTAYYNVSGKINKFTWQAGLRGEYSSIEINSNSHSDYGVLLPQFSLNQSLPSNQSIKFTYRKQISRPSINSLNPFTTWSDSLHMEKGNPNLDPSIENRLELTYTKNFKANYLSPKIYMRYTTNGIQDNTYITDKGVTVITQENVGRNLEYGLAINGAFQVFKIWRINASVSAFDRTIKTDPAIAGHRYEEKLSYRFNCSNIFTLPKDYSLFVFADYGSPSVSYQRVQSRQLLVLFGGEKKFSDKLSLEAIYNPLIKDFMYQKVVTETPGYHESWEGHIDVTQLFCFTLTYNFNRGNKINKINRSAEYERTEGKGGM
jgi:ferric enterobactin receptor